MPDVSVIRRTRCPTYPLPDVTVTRYDRCPMIRCQIIHCPMNPMPGVSVVRYSPAPHDDSSCHTGWKANPWNSARRMGRAPSHPQGHQKSGFGAPSHIEERFLSSSSLIPRQHIRSSDPAENDNRAVTDLTMTSLPAQPVMAGTYERMSRGTWPASTHSAHDSPAKVCQSHR